MAHVPSTTGPVYDQRCTLDERRLLDCAVCSRSRHGAWPQGHPGTHCRDCHQSWAGNGAHTLCCHRTFSSNSAADDHLVRGVCTDPAAIPGFELVERAHGYRYWTPMTGVETRDFSDEDGPG